MGTAGVSEIVERYISIVEQSRDVEFEIFDVGEAVSGPATLLYVRVYDPVKNLANEYDIPTNALLCGRALGN